MVWVSFGFHIWFGYLPAIWNCITSSHICTTMMTLAWPAYRRENSIGDPKTGPPLWQIYGIPGNLIKDRVGKFSSIEKIKKGYETFLMKDAIYQNQSQSHGTFDVDGVLTKLIDGEITKQTVVYKVCPGLCAGSVASNHAHARAYICRLQHARVQRQQDINIAALSACGTHASGTLRLNVLSCREMAHAMSCRGWRTERLFLTT